MPSSLNKVLLIGNLGKDAETRHTQSGTAVTTFSVATTFRTKDQQSGEWREGTDWHDVVLWRGENIAKYLTKGKKVGIEGRLKTRSWDDQNGQKRYRTEVVCDMMGLILLGGRDAAPGGGGYDQSPSGGYGQGGGSGSSAPSGGEPSTPPSVDDDIPF